MLCVLGDKAFFLAHSSHLGWESFETAEISEKCTDLRCHTLERMHSMYGLRSRLISAFLRNPAGKKRTSSVFSAHPSEAGERYASIW